MKIYENVIQGEQEWFDLKRGMFSASNFGKLFSAKSTDRYKSLINKLVFERASGTTVETYKNASMQRGTDLEPYGRESYELKTFKKVKEVGLIVVNKDVVISPDGLIGLNGGLEIKCLEYNALINFMTTKKIPTDYMWQIQGCLWGSEREWWDYFVYHPDFKTEPLRVYRDEEAIKKLEIELEIAIELVETKIKLVA